MFYPVQNLSIICANGKMHGCKNYTNEFEVECKPDGWGPLDIDWYDFIYYLFATAF